MSATGAYKVTPEEKPLLWAVGVVYYSYERSRPGVGCLKEAAIFGLCSRTNGMKKTEFRIFVEKKKKSQNIWFFCAWRVLLVIVMGTNIARLCYQDPFDDDGSDPFCPSVLQGFLLWIGLDRVGHIANQKKYRYRSRAGLGSRSICHWWDDSGNGQDVCYSADWIQVYEICFQD